MKEKGLTYNEYLKLHEPALSWLCRAVGVHATKEDFTKVLEHYRDYCGNTLVLKHIILHFNASFWSSSTAGMVQLIKDAKPSNAKDCAEGTLPEQPDPNSNPEDDKKPDLSIDKQCKPGVLGGLI